MQKWVSADRQYLPREMDGIHTGAWMNFSIERLEADSLRRDLKRSDVWGVVLSCQAQLLEIFHDSIMMEELCEKNADDFLPEL